MCVYVCLNAQPFSRSKNFVWSRIKVRLHTAASPIVPEMEITYANGGGGGFFFEDVTLVEFIYFVFTRMPGGGTVGDSGLCCCVPCLLSAINIVK